MRILLILLITMGATGCAVGNRYSFETEPAVVTQGTGSVAVAAKDLRPYVLSGEKGSDYVGTQRGGFGNPFNVGTASHRPLADEFGRAVGDSLSRGGFKVNVVSARATPQADARALAAESGASRLALVEIAEWKSDTFQNVGLNYDLTLRIFDASGKELGSHRVSGNDNLGGSAWNPPAHARRAVPQAFRQKIEQLLGAESVARALR
jgi:hypothetical protein